MNDNEAELAHVVRHLDWTSALEIAAVIAGAWLLTIVVRAGIPRLADRLRPSGRMKILPWIPVLRFLILLAAIALIIPIVIRPTLGNMVVIFGTIGLAIGFAFKDYLSDVIGGVVAIAERTYRPGDWVRIDDAYGEVRSVGLRSLSIVTPDDTVVFIPHSRLWSTNVYNANAGKRDLMCVADFFLHPDHDAAAVRQGLADVAVSSPYVNLSRSITVILADEPWGAHYRVKAYPIDSRYQFEFISDLTVRAKMVFSRLGAVPVTAQVAKGYDQVPTSRSGATV
ncbi:MAG: mechanosensitive ion channel domain-containing protein [Chromatiaceae bacterium]|jgi:small conductance mechanosensitive channel